MTKRTETYALEDGYWEGLRNSFEVSFSNWDEECDVWDRGQQDGEADGKALARKFNDGAEMTWSTGRNGQTVTGTVGEYRKLFSRTLYSLGWTNRRIEYELFRDFARSEGLRFPKTLRLQRQKAA